MLAQSTIDPDASVPEESLISLSLARLCGGEDDLEGLGLFLEEGYDTLRCLKICNVLLSATELHQ